MQHNGQHDRFGRSLGPVHNVAVSLGRVPGWFVLHIRSSLVDFARCQIHSTLICILFAFTMLCAYDRLHECPHPQLASSQSAALHALAAHLHA